MPNLMQQTPAQRHVPVAPSSDSVDAKRELALAKIRSTPDLPTLPSIALQVIEMASDPDCDPDGLLRILTHDPSLCARLLRTVNSVMYGLRRPISSVSSAVRFLGLNPLRSHVLTLTLSTVRHRPMDTVLLQRYWRVSVAGAIAARRLALRGRRTDPDTDLVAGLVRDLGMLVLAQVFPTEYQAILDTSPVILSGFQCELEERELQINHAEVSSELLRLWRLPAQITEPVRVHHDWDSIAQMTGDLADRARLLYFAAQIGQLQLTADRPMLVRQVLTLADEQFGMNEKELRTFLSTVAAETSEFASIMQVEIGDVLGYTDVIARGAEELARLKASIPGAREIVAPARDHNPTVTLGKKLAEPNQALVSRGINRDPAEPGAKSGLASEFAGAFEGYEIVELIGQGGMGAVFRAFDKRLERPVAIKMMLPHLACEARSRAQFIKEGQAVAALSHENVVRVYAVGEHAGAPYMVMEFVRGESLSKRIERHAPFPLADILRIGLQTASGLNAAHAAGLVHRDIKPANLLLEETTGRVKIADFGLAQLVHQVGASDEGLAGTPCFMSPEQADGKRVDARSDMFSLGCVLYQICTGELAFDAETIPGVLKAICETTPPPIRSLNPAIPPWLEEIVGGLLTKDPARRFPMAADMKRLFLCRWAKLYTGASPAPAGRR